MVRSSNPIFYTSEWPPDKEEIQLKPIFIFESCREGTLIQFNVKTHKKFHTSFQMSFCLKHLDCNRKEIKDCKIIQL